MRLVILGGSGSGKSTQAQHLGSHLEIPLVATGDVLRAAIASNSELGQLAQPFIERGELVPDELMIEFVRSRLKEADVGRGWILEGYPRTAFQAEELDFLLDHLGQKLNWAIYLQVPEAVMVSRSLGRSLPDDQPEIVQRRIELFYDRTIPILEYYDRRRRLLTINGDQSPDMVLEKIISLVG
ncbi:nucleoside monophosphate kinase [Calothrix sp. UHCC 0171]|uniref:adenylate kinase family protein n=1 Tax=Calothrix sp. UHCC 0171 TaxID=3110245 RepID=UPI002B1FFC0D|nr:nucleoside monophosphate kinase [Calothrix sp. UHCC 0171]MEA5570542.1 nucleoside monophosphate kinase [Calothrix sp. UHCC 0171]